MSAIFTRVIFILGICVLNINADFTEDQTTIIKGLRKLFSSLDGWLQVHPENKMIAKLNGCIQTINNKGTPATYNETIECAKSTFGNLQGTIRTNVHLEKMEEFIRAYVSGVSNNTDGTNGVPLQAELNKLIENYGKKKTE